MVQRKVHVVRAAEDFMFRASCCDKEMSKYRHENGPGLLKIIYTSIRQTVLSSQKRSVDWNKGDAEGPKGVRQYLQVLRYDTENILDSRALVPDRFSAV